MTTLEELVKRKELEQIDPALRHWELPLRCLYGTNEFISWTQEELPNLPHEPMYGMRGREMLGDLRPREQAISAFRGFVLGKPYSRDSRFKKLKPTDVGHIWELRTSALRIFGWFPKKDSFVCCFGGYSETVHANHLFNYFKDLSVNVRDNLDLDEPKALEGEELEDVISNGS